jgi:dihydrofolate reductase
MGKVVIGLTMSLDGFIAGPNDGPDLGLGEGGERLFDWYFKGDTEYVAPSGDLTFKVSPADAEFIRESFSTIGAVISGRRTFDITNGWNGRHTLDVPVVVVTHTVPEAWVREHDGAPFTFATDGIERAVATAKEIAGDKDIGVAAASIAQQCIRAGLLDEIHVTVAPVLLGGGVRLFEHLGADPIALEKIRAVDTPEVTHLGFRIVTEGARA